MMNEVCYECGAFYEKQEYVVTDLSNYKLGTSASISDWTTSRKSYVSFKARRASTYHWR